jgi:hypothetical protein
MLTLNFRSASGRERNVKVNLEEIWSSGALLQTDAPIPLSTQLWFAGGGHRFRGEATARTFCRTLGYFVEMRFHSSCRWSRQRYSPKHLLNAHILGSRCAGRRERLLGHFSVPSCLPVSSELAQKSPVRSARAKLMPCATILETLSMRLHPSLRAAENE